MQTPDTVGDDAQFYNDLIHTNSLVVVVKATIHIEQEVIKLIHSVVYDANAFDKIDLTYLQRIQLAIALGLEPRFLRPLKALGEIRNKFAHVLRHELNKNDVDGFYDAFDPLDKQVIQDTYARVRKSDVMKLRKPKKIAGLTPLDRFALCATTLRGALISARRGTHLHEQHS
ncbi:MULTISPECIES: hypothetical protein [unclassified Sinorhizobium]|uniref:hypothetical protein n=1 Tax=unclassified Sinorhizobium TaxID=2613772 RepID=UPI0024C32476|nr:MULTISPECIES: hypothetical protein [unclassified Sinorhizobium]MDK1377111.1 hypothetical protein [Sinorhizobium sp. 6-70]MDK1479594.1 hypothetical protein [Sinorhizobium sp. 6-117]